MRYVDTYLKQKHKGNFAHPFVVLKNRFRTGEDPDLRMEMFLRGWGEWSVDAAINFERQLARDRELKILGVI